MDDFEPSDQLTTEIEGHETQAYLIHIEKQPTIIKTVMALTNEEPNPIIVKIFKKGEDKPVKDLRGKTEVLDIVEIIEDDDIGTYIVEFTNTGSYIQDLTFIIKQIPIKKWKKPEKSPSKDASSKEKGSKNKVAVPEPEEEEDEKRKKLSEEEKRMYDVLTDANKELKHFEVEQGM